VPNATLEGDNTIMLLQTAKILMGELRHVMSGKELSDSTNYLAEEPRNMEQVMSSKAEVRKLPNLLQLWKGATCQAVRNAGQKLMAGSKDFGGSFRDSWDKGAGLKLFEASKMHIILFSLNAIINAIPQFKSQSNRDALERVALHFGLSQMLKNLIPFMEAKVISASTVILAREVEEELLGEIRQDLVGWTECFGFDDMTIASALGERDSDPYERMFEDAKTYGEMNKVDRERIAKDTLFRLRGLNPKL
jgi:acyl-CoA oxidase